MIEIVFITCSKTVNYKYLNSKMHYKAKFYKLSTLATMLIWNNGNPKFIALFLDYSSNEKKLKYVQKTFNINFLETYANSMLLEPIMCCEKLKINVIYSMKSMSELKGL